MTKKSKAVRYVTPKGTAQYPYLTKPDTKFNPDGDYKISLELEAADATEIVSFLDEQLEQAIASAKEANKGKKTKEGDAPYSVNDDTGKVTVRFKLKAKVSPKNGDPFEQKVALFDAKGAPLGAKVNIGGGSKVKVAYEVTHYNSPVAGAGVSLRLRAVQVIDLVEYSSGGAGAFGFGEEDGYEADTTATEDDFTDETSKSEEDF